MFAPPLTPRTGGPLMESLLFLSPLLSPALTLFLSLSFMLETNCRQTGRNTPFLSPSLKRARLHTQIPFFLSQKHPFLLRLRAGSFPPLPSSPPIKRKEKGPGAYSFFFFPPRSKKIGAPALIRKTFFFPPPTKFVFFFFPPPFFYWVRWFGLCTKKTSERSGRVCFPFPPPFFG